MKTRNSVLAALGLVVALGGAASAQTTFDQNHPRREEVNARLANQNARIRTERDEGEMGVIKAHRMHRLDHRIRMQERRFASRHNGRISLAEQHRLNREENAVGRRIDR